MGKDQGDDLTKRRETKGENVDDDGSISDKVAANFEKGNKMEDLIGRSHLAVGVSG